jgi:hypothetical protein
MASRQHLTAHARAAANPKSGLGWGVFFLHPPMGSQIDKASAWVLFGPQTSNLPLAEDVSRMEKRRHDTEHQSEETQRLALPSRRENDLKNYRVQAFT